MELVQIFGVLRGRKLLLGLVTVLAIAAAAAILLKPRAVPTGAASAQVIVDSPRSALADLRQDTAPLNTRASVVAQLMASAVILKSVARITGIPVGQITAEGPFTGAGASQNVVTPAEARSSQVTSERKVYRLTFVPQALTPVVTISGYGPSPQAAAKLADAVYPATAAYISSLGVSPPATGQPTPSGRPAAQAGAASSAGIPRQFRVTLRQLGPAQTGASSAGSVAVIAAIGFLGVLLLGCLAILGLEAIRPRRVRPAAAVTGSSLAAARPAVAAKSLDEPSPSQRRAGAVPTSTPPPDSW